MQVIIIFTTIFSMNLQCSQYMQMKKPEKKNNCYYYSYTVKVKHLVAVKKTNASVPDWKIAIMLWN